MQPEHIILEIVTPERQLAEESVNEVQLPGLKGYLGILPGHAPLITELGIGEMVYRKGAERHHLAVVHGYAEVLPDRVIVLAERADRAEEVDGERAQAAKKRAEERLGKLGDPDVDWDRATFALQRALIRLQVAAKGSPGSASSNEPEEHPPAP